MKEYSLYDMKQHSSYDLEDPQVRLVSKQTIEEDFQELRNTGFSALQKAMFATARLLDENKRDLAENLPPELTERYFSLKKAFLQRTKLNNYWIRATEYCWLVSYWRDLVEERKIIVNAHLFYRKYQRDHDET